MGRAKNAKNDEFARDLRRRKVASMYLTGKSQQETARAMGVDQATVCRDLAAVRDEWRAAAVQDYDQRVALELAKIDRLEALANEAWLRSCEPADERSREVVRRPGATAGEKGDETLDRVVRRHTRRTGVGDPRFLERISACIEMRIELLGLKPVSSRGPTVNVVQINWDALAGGGPSDERPVPAET